jgi:hypothetical protein
MAGPPVDPAAMVAVDAWTGDEVVRGRFAPDYRAWALTRPAYGKPLQRPDPADPKDWADPEVGWGVVLAEPEGLTPQQLATADDAPEPVRQLVADRHGKVLRYRAGSTYADWTLRDYAGGGDLLTAGSPMGSGPLQLPKYLLIYGSPTEVPWRVQYTLNPVRCVGRLDLDGQGLENYVAALRDGWSTATTSYRSPVVWAVDHGGGDITTLMRDTVAGPVFDALRKDKEITAPVFLDGTASPATATALVEALAASRPSLVVTSSHGMTGPLHDIDAMRATLGMPVDQLRTMVSPDSLLAAWQPDGAVWFAQACCSAGAESPTAYQGLFEAGSTLDQTLAGVAAVGAVTAPLARALLGAARPLRAFVGHVEPTFDWTLAFPPNRQALTSDLVTALYTRLCLGDPVGLALSGYFPAIGSLLQGYVAARTAYNNQVGPAAKPSLDMLVYSRVSAHDRASTVILGDPTVAIPLPGAGD